MQANTPSTRVEPSFIKEADSAMQHFHATGMHLSYDEMQNWLESWTTDNPNPLPPCHT